MSRRLKGDIPGRMKNGRIDVLEAVHLSSIPDSASRLLSIYRRGMSGLKQSAAEI